MVTRDIVYIALFAAITAALALFPPLMIPVVAVPITAQSMGPMLAGSIIGARRGALSLLLFLVLVAVGLPLLSGGRGGLGVFFGPTGGFLLSWPIAAGVVGLLRGTGPGSWPRALLANVVGGIVCVYALGIPWLIVAAHLEPMKALLGSAIFIPGDLVKVGLTVAIANLVHRARPEAAFQT